MGSENGKSRKAIRELEKDKNENTALIAKQKFIRNQETSPLLRLPGEVRNKIYSYCAEYCRVGIQLNKASSSMVIDYSMHWVFSHTNSLVKTSRQLYNEYSPILLGLCAFHLHIELRETRNGFTRLYNEIDHIFLATVRVLSLHDRHRKFMKEAAEVDIGQKLPNLRTFIFLIRMRRIDRAIPPEIEEMCQEFADFFKKPALEVWIRGSGGIIFRRTPDGKVEAPEVLKEVEKFLCDSKSL
ncbi:unnamed protein product [Periconia digitata]|uniref:Uncharacterized protein n=1 Tax=Periconia digitata TaxID=1303443 RepID=A0A9W4U4K2_9PLEO|nr:unnamed protein product [Periconia digitata]